MSHSATFLRAAHAGQAALTRGWLASPVAAADAPVPESTAQVDAAVLNLQDGLRELQLTATPHVTAAAQDLYTAVRAAADAQFDLHIQNVSSTERLCALDEAAFTRHTDAVRQALEAFVAAAHREGVSVTATASDRAKAMRTAQAVQPDAAWLTHLSRRMPMRRIPDFVTEGVGDALEALRRDVIDFVDPELNTAHRRFADALARLDDEIGGTFTPDHDAAYSEVPPEWQRTAPERYAQTLRNLSRARDTVLDRYKELMNAMSRRGHLPTPQEPQPGSSVQITAGDNSPITVNAPYAHATQGGNASAGQPAPADQATGSTPLPWYRSGIFWGAVSALATVAGVVVAYLALGK
ncbi:hypothetical protein IM697_23695 [Streptomyces ferrugineus]|uniref:Uncharacterized protein n=1 Tax=Streptomyces ferrugineus TaxID=1413221 RepID=A0A7M2SCN4_9ACTN|nr:hypothetical protein [Streptomyces ferrugineus]QOV33248.1 hypothetical protein IM697_23695 [Streptomyces ferrugineus]